MRDASPPGRYVLKLYVSGVTPNSMRAIRNLRALCEEELKGADYTVEVIDLYENPDAAREAEIVAAPTLVKSFPPPMMRLIGDLSDRRRVVAALGIILLRTDSVS